MPPSLPARKFNPSPVETSTKSSKDAKQQSPEKEEKPKPRRFAVEPVSTEHKSSKAKGEEEEKPKPRRFAPEPVETSQKSNRDASEADDKPKARRFAPQLVEETPSRHGSRYNTNADKPGHIRFSPQLAEPTFRTNRRQVDDDGANGNNGTEARSPRKFAPVLVDTARRSRRAGDDKPALSQHDKTEAGHYLHAREHRRHIRGDKTPVGEGVEGAGAGVLPQDGHLNSANLLALHPELRREVAPLDGSAPRRLSMASQRSHSFRCPELDTIDSSESEPVSQTSSLSSSPNQGSPITGSDSSFNDVYKHATRRRESIDETFQQYLLQLEAKKAQQRLEEQALAAFANSDYHEPVAHYVMDDGGSDDMEIEDRPVTWASYDEEVLLSMARRRESTAKVTWEQLEMQRHAERLEQERNAAKTTAKRPTQSPWWNPDAAFGLGDYDQELQSMQDRARPPMLGSDLVFPRCPSPEPARFDVTQGSDVLRNQMCYLTEHVEAGKRSEEEPGLWHASETEDRYVANARSVLSISSKSTNKGLWGGFCVDDGQSSAAGGLNVPRGPTGLMTPAVEHTTNPFEQSFAVPGNAVPMGIGLKTPDTPPRSLRDGDLGTIDGILNAEQDLDETMENDYPDSFITQVYNYLSLGYPSLAKPFDEELSKISRIPIAELRQDDKKAKTMPKGYIRLGPDFEGGGGEGATAQSCMRWQALKLYIREWARQEKDMVKVDGPGGNWGTTARRGSWGI